MLCTPDFFSFFLGGGAGSQYSTELSISQFIFFSQHKVMYWSWKFAEDDTSSKFCRLQYTFFSFRKQDEAYDKRVNSQNTNRTNHGSVRGLKTSIVSCI